MKEIYNKIIECSKNFDTSENFLWAGEGQQIKEKRAYPARWIKKTLEFIKILDAKVMIEIGSTRFETLQKCLNYYDNCDSVYGNDRPACCEDGHSTHFWTTGNFEEIHTVDIQDDCKIQIQNQYTHHIKTEMPKSLNIHTQDGVSFLKNFDKQIDFLYLDGWDVGTVGYLESHLKAFQSAKNKLSPLHLISIDDTDFEIKTGPDSNPGKNALLTPYLLELGYKEILKGRQSVYINSI